MTESSWRCATSQSPLGKMPNRPCVPQMSALLSTAMIPSIYVLGENPLTFTGKKDRKALVARPKAMDQDNITEMVQTRPANGRPVETNQQRELRQTCARVLDCTKGSITLNSNPVCFGIAQPGLKPHRRHVPLLVHARVPGCSINVGSAIILMYAAPNLGRENAALAW